MKNKIVIFLCLLIFSGVTLGATQTNTGQVADIRTYSTYGDGDVVFRMTTMPTSCSGFWLRKSDSGFDGYFSLLLSAFHASTTISIAAFDDDIWSGSSSAPYCRVDWILLTK